jgi:hypothetical protein
VRLCIVDLSHQRNHQIGTMPENEGNIISDHCTFRSLVSATAAQMQKICKRLFCAGTAHPNASRSGFVPGDPFDLLFYRSGFLLRAVLQNLLHQLWQESTHRCVFSLDPGARDDAALADMDRPEACLSPAVCYHVYHLYEGRTIPPLAAVHGICSKCFRYESSNIKDLRRLWDFTIREVVFMGAREEVLAARDRSIEMMSDFLKGHALAGEIRTASDPFFIAPEATSKTYFQLSSDSKFEVSLLLSGGERLAVGSHNYHSDFFGRVFNVNVETGGPMHSVCVAFGLERWVYAFLQQHGSNPAKWPDPIRNAPEFSSLAKNLVASD